MIMGEFGSLFDLQRKAAMQRKLSAPPPRANRRPPPTARMAANCNQRFAQCVRQRSFLPAAQKQRGCAIQLQQCRNPRAHLFGAEFGYTDPYVRMAEGLEERWNRKDPRAALTNVNAMTYEQSHPQMNGASSFSLWSWLKGDYRRI